MATVSVETDLSFLPIRELHVSFGDYIKSDNDTTVWLITSSVLAVSLENGQLVEYRGFIERYRKLLPGEIITTTV